MRSKRGVSGCYWEIWWLPGDFAMQGALREFYQELLAKELSSKKLWNAVVGWLCRRLAFGTLDIVARRVRAWIETSMSVSSNKNFNMKGQSMVSFGAVMDVLAGERRYQDKKHGPLKDRPHDVGGWLTIMRHLLARADKAWAENRDDRDALDEIRKVTAVGVACMEQHGLVSRAVKSTE